MPAVEFARGLIPPDTFSACGDSVTCPLGQDPPYYEITACDEDDKDEVI